MSTPLPPTPRDFDIHKMHLVQFASTRTIAQKHGISQTRVRQVVQRVSHWLAAALPVKTEVEQEQETRLAQHLAADQLRNQLEDLRILWDATHDPKYFRQQTRVITALAASASSPAPSTPSPPTPPPAPSTPPNLSLPGPKTTPGPTLQVAVTSAHSECCRPSPT